MLIFWWANHIWAPQTILDQSPSTEEQEEKNNRKKTCFENFIAALRHLEWVLVSNMISMISSIDRRCVEVINRWG